MGMTDETNKELVQGQSGSFPEDGQALHFLRIKAR